MSQPSLFEVCGILHGDGTAYPVDALGCILPNNHGGSHEFIDAEGRHWLWETDLSCECLHCLESMGDYCTIYWEK
jgi:hypothetical protein